jgi:DNA mismatch repair ATPase MutL
MNICCPSNSYDPNVEPAKDDVLFDDSETLLSVVRQFLNGWYPIGHASHLEVSDPSSEITSLASESCAVPDGSHQTSGPYGPTRSSMNTSEASSNQHRRASEHAFEENTEQPSRLESSNPWTIALINSSKASYQPAPLIHPPRGDQTQSPGSSPRAGLEQITPSQTLPPLLPNTPLSETLRDPHGSKCTSIESSSKASYASSSRNVDTASESPAGIRTPNRYDDRDFTRLNEPSSDMTLASSPPLLISQSQGPRKCRDSNKRATSPTKNASKPAAKSQKLQNQSQQRPLNGPDTSPISIGSENHHKPPESAEVPFVGSQSRQYRDIRQFLRRPGTHGRQMQQGTQSSSENAGDQDEARESQLFNARDGRSGRPDDDLLEEDETPEDLFRRFSATTRPDKHVRPPWASKEEITLDFSQHDEDANALLEISREDYFEAQSNQRHRSRRSTRTRSLRLPLEYIPANSRMQNVVLPYTITLDALKVASNSLYFRTPIPSNMGNGLELPFHNVRSAVVQRWSRRVYQLLSKTYPNEETTFNVDESLRMALSKFSYSVVDVDDEDFR